MATREKILALVNRLEGDELAIVLQLLQRIDMGRRDYGVWQIGPSKRNYKAEAMEEVVDALHYAAAYLVRNGGDND